MNVNWITEQDFPGIRWRGHWIWVPEEQLTRGGPFPGDISPAAPESHGLFRRTFHLDQVPRRAPARITADSRYVLFVNGAEVVRGPIRSQPRRMYYDLCDLAPYLTAGKNALAIYVKYYGTATSFWQPAVPNMMLGKSGALVFEANLGAAGWICSDASWRAHKSTAWTPADRSGVPIEIIDARRLPSGWRESDFDDAGWGHARLVPAVHFGGFARTQPPTDPYGPLHPRPIAHLTGSLRTPAQIQAESLAGTIPPTVTDPVRALDAALALPVVDSNPAGLPITLTISPAAGARLVIDMGRVVSGLVAFSLEAPAGTIVDLSYREKPLVEPGTHLSQHSGTRYIARGHADSFQVFDSNGFRYAYLLFHGAAAQIKLTHFAVREHLYPWRECAAFSCSDEGLNRIFQAGLRTVQLNSHDAFIDCPTREQRAWVGDGVVHQMVHLTTNGDWRLAWHYLTLGNSPRADGILPMSVVGDIESTGCYTIPDWSLHWVHGVYNLFRYSGDRERIKAFMPTIERVLRWYLPYLTRDGVLKDVAEWNLVDWSSVLVEDTSSLLTALWARGLREYAAMAEWLEEKTSRRWSNQLYEQVRAGFEIFWDEERGSYVDHVMDGRQRRPMSQLSGALAIASGLAPERRWGRIVDTITDPERLVVRSWIGGQGGYSDEKMERQFQGRYDVDWDAERQIVLAQPFMSYVVHDAVALAEQAHRLPAMYRRWAAFLAAGYDTLGECWGWGTHAHGWSCTPTRDMIAYTLGVTPAKPGFTAARIAPRPGDLNEMSGRVPTPHGMISVSMTADLISVESPVPFILDLPGQPARPLPAGRHATPHSWNPRAPAPPHVS